jgi:uncharacterized protein (TIGR03437 family)
VAERFSTEEELDIFTAAQKFYLNHEDAYDYLVFFNNFNLGADSGAVAYEVTVRNDRSGYGDVPVNVGAVTGSRKRLLAIMNMGHLAQYPVDPKAVAPARWTSGDTTLSILGHEAGHLFLAYASVSDDGAASPMLGRQTAHWAFTFNSEASLLEGNRIQDNGQHASPRFVTAATVEAYSPLDRYLMGLIPKEQVPDTFYVTDSTQSATRSPQVGVAFNGTRRNVNIDEVIAAVGRRTPDHTVSQKRFRFAFVLVTRDGQEPTPDQVEQVERYRREFETYFNQAAGGLAWAETSLVRSAQVSAFPAAGVVEGGRTTVSVALEKPAEADVTFTVGTQSGAISAPGAVTIPAGQTSGSFSVAAVRAGVDDLILRASGYAESYSRIQVAAARDLKLQIVSGDNQTGRPGQVLPAPIAIRLTDSNGLPYTGVTLQAAANSGGSVSPASVATDESGSAQFRWTPGAGDANLLRISGPGGITATASTVGNPAINAAGVVNAASFTGAIVPGSLATAFGVNLAGADPSNISLKVNGTQALVLYAGATQVNFVVPSNISGSTAQVVVTTSAGQSAPVQAAVAQYAPGIFFDGATGFGAILTNKTGQRTEVVPVARGGYIEIFATGLGAVNSSGLLPAGLVEVCFSTGCGAPAYAGSAPGFIGLYQINAQVPAALAAGVQTVRINASGLPSNTVNIKVQ